MKNVRLFLAAFRQAEALKARVGKGAVVVAGLVAGDRRDGFESEMRFGPRRLKNLEQGARRPRVPRAPASVPAVPR